MTNKRDNVVNFEKQRQAILAASGMMSPRKEPDSRMKIGGPRQVTQVDDAGSRAAIDTANQWMVQLNVPLADADISIPALLARARARRAIGLAQKLTGFKIPSQVLARLGAKTPQQTNPFKLPDFPPAAVPTKESGGRMAMDEFDGSLWASENFLNFAQTSIGSIFAEGLAFPGYAFLAEQAQRPEYRRFAEILSTEMTRKWIEFKSSNTTGDKNHKKGKSDKIKQLTKRCEDLELRPAVRRVVELDELFGRAHIYVDTGATDDREELRTSIGNGRDETSRAKIVKGTLKAFRPVEPVWCYPTYYDSNDPLQKDWYEPTNWFVMGKQVHSTRLLKFVGREVPDLLKPAYSFGGLSMTQMSKPYVDIWLRTRQSVADLIHSFSVFVLKLNMGAMLEEGGEELIRRIMLFNATRDNRNVMALDKDTEEFENVTAPLGGLDQLQAQTQEHMAAVSGIPIVKLLGIQPTGLNASDEGGIRMFYDWVAASQEKRLRKHVQTLVDFVQLDLWGEIDEDIIFEFIPLYELDELQEAQKRQTEMQTDIAAVDGGVLSPEEVRERVAADPDSPYASIDVDDVPNLQSEEEGGLDPRAGVHKGTGRPPRAPDDRGGGKGGGGHSPPGPAGEGGEGDDDYPDEMEPSPHDYGSHWPVESSQQGFERRVGVRGYRHDNEIGSHYQGVRAHEYRHDNRIDEFYDRADSRSAWANARSEAQRAAFEARVHARGAAHGLRRGDFYDRADARSAAHARGEGTFYDRVAQRDAERAYVYRQHLAESGEDERLDQFVGLLAAAGSDPEAFWQAIQAIEEDPSLTRFDISFIADRYDSEINGTVLNGVVFRSRGAAISHIEKLFARRTTREDHADPVVDGESREKLPDNESPIEENEE